MICLCQVQGVLHLVDGGDKCNRKMYDIVELVRENREPTVQDVVGKYLAENI